MYISLFLTSRENHCLHISFIEICATCANELIKKRTANLSEFRGQYKLGLFSPYRYLVLEVPIYERQYNISLMGAFTINSKSNLTFSNMLIVFEFMLILYCLVSL